MKKTTLLTICAIIAFGAISTAQNETDITELIDRLHGNHMGSIYDVFTVDEVAQLQAHFDTQNNVTPLRYGGGGDMPIRAIENTKGNFSNIHRDNLATTEIIAPSPLTEFEGAGATIPGSARAVVADNSNNFYEVSPNGEYILVGTILPAAGQSFTGLEFTSDGELFGIATDDGVVMATYLTQIFDRNTPKNKKEIRASIVEAGEKRIRPCLMTTATTILALLPVLTSTGRGSDIMIPMAIPSFGGMLIALITLFVVPVLYSWKAEIQLKKSAK